MSDILIISPISIAGELILKGFKKGFEHSGHSVSFMDVREFKGFNCSDFDCVLCYDYGYMVEKSAFNFVLSLLEKNKNIKIIHYFADNPSLKYAHSGDESLEEKFSALCLKYPRNIKPVFWDREYLSEFRGVDSKFFPLCVDCGVYKNLGLEKKYDITFLGRPLGEFRQRILSTVVKNFPDKLKIFSYPEHFKSSICDMKKYLNDFELENYKNSFCGFINTQEELARVYNQTKINLNINLQGEGSLNYRTFEVLACDGFMLCDRRADISALGLDEALVQYDNEDDLVRKISYFLKNDSEREKISARAGKLIYERYNIILKADEILNPVE